MLITGGSFLAISCCPAQNSLEMYIFTVGRHENLELLALLLAVCCCYCHSVKSLTKIFWGWTATDWNWSYRLEPHFSPYSLSIWTRITVFSIFFIHIDWDHSFLHIPCPFIQLFDHQIKFHSIRPNFEMLSESFVSKYLVGFRSSSKCQCLSWGWCFVIYSRGEMTAFWKLG